MSAHSSSTLKSKTTASTYTILEEHDGNPNIVGWLLQFYNFLQVHARKSNNMELKTSNVSCKYSAYWKGQKERKKEKEKEQ
jgi:hypothetical protein